MPEKLGRNLAREGGAQHPLPLLKLHQLAHGGMLQSLFLTLCRLLPSPTQPCTWCYWCFLNCSVNDFCSTPQRLEQIPSQHTWAGLKGWIALALPHFFSSQSAGDHLPQGPAAPRPCWCLLQGTMTFPQHWPLGCRQCQSPGEPSPTVKHSLTLNVASKKTIWGLLCERALPTGEEMASKHAGEGEAVPVSGLV